MTVRARLFLMMVLQLAVWGAWAPKLFPYMGMLHFSPWQQSLVGSCWGIAAVLNRSDVPPNPGPSPFTSFIDVVESTRMAEAHNPGSRPISVTASGKPCRDLNQMR